MDEIGLYIDDILIPPEALGRWSQEYITLGGRAKLRFSDGSGLVQTAWSRIGTTITGEGWAPAGLDGLDFGAPHTLKCLKPVVHAAPVNIITLPTARRADVPVLGYALVGGRLVETAVALAGDVATLTPVAGASGYRALAIPQIVVHIDPIVERVDGTGAVYGWSLTVEEV